MIDPNETPTPRTESLLIELRKNRIVGSDVEKIMDFANVMLQHARYLERELQAVQAANRRLRESMTGLLEHVNRIKGDVVHPNSHGRGLVYKAVTEARAAAKEGA